MQLVKVEASMEEGSKATFVLQFWKHPSSAGQVGRTGIEEPSSSGIDVWFRRRWKQNNRCLVSEVMDARSGEQFLAHLSAYSLRRGLPRWFTMWVCH